MIHRVIHPKIKWAGVAGVASAALQALIGVGGVSLPAWAASLCTALVAVLAGYAAPEPNQDPEA